MHNPGAISWPNTALEDVKYSFTHTPSYKKTIYYKFTILIDSTHCALLTFPPSALSTPSTLLFLLLLPFLALFLFIFLFLLCCTFLWSSFDACSTGSVFLDPCQVIFDPHIKPWRGWCKKWKITWTVSCSTVQYSARQCSKVQDSTAQWSTVQDSAS